MDTWINKLSFPKLKFLELDNIPNHTRFCFETFIEFPMMTNLTMTTPSFEDVRLQLFAYEHEARIEPFS